MSKSTSGLKFYKVFILYLRQKPDGLTETKGKLQESTKLKIGYLFAGPSIPRGKKFGVTLIENKVLTVVLNRDFKDLRLGNDLKY